MKISSQQLAKDAKASGYRPEILEKVFHLLKVRGSSPLGNVFTEYTYGYFRFSE